MLLWKKFIFKSVCSSFFFIYFLLLLRVKIEYQLPERDVGPVKMDKKRIRYKDKSTCNTSQSNFQRHPFGQSILLFPHFCILGLMYCFFVLFCFSVKKINLFLRQHLYEKPNLFENFINTLTVWYCINKILNFTVRS